MEYSYTHGKTLQTGEEIRNFQYKLNEIRDAFHCPWSHLTTDGVFGRNTRDAVKAFQIFANVSPVTGNLDSNTQRAIDVKYRESQRTYSSVKKQIDNYQYADALYTEGGVFLQESGGGVFLQESSAVVDEIWDSNKAQLESISKDVIDIVTAIVSDRSQQSLNNKFLARQGEIKKLWEEYSEIMNRPKPALTPFNKPGYNNLESFYNATQERVDVNQGRLYQRRLNKGPEFSKLLKNEADAHLKRVAGAKALSKAGYVIPVFDMFYHGSKYLFAEGHADTTKCKKEFEKSLEDGLATIAVGVATDLGAKAVAGAAGGPYGVAVVVIVSLLDCVLISATGKSLSDRLVQTIKEYPWREYTNMRKDVPHPLI
jgi:hypothetical protein